MKTITINDTCPNCGAEQTFEVLPPRPAPACSNHDSPVFSDPGDPGEVNPIECPTCGKEFPDTFLDKLEDKALEIAREY